MGAFANISDRGASKRRLRCAIGSLVSALIVGFASIASADPANDARSPDPHTTASDRAPAAEAAVSTSPVALGMPGLSAESDPVAVDADAMPLTRAASQQRVDEMSPMSWLSSYGNITIGQTR